MRILELVVPLLAPDGVEVAGVDVDALGRLPLGVHVGHVQPHDLHLAVDGAAEGVAAGAEEDAGVDVLELHGAVPGPEVRVADHRPDVSGITLA